MKRARFVLLWCLAVGLGAVGPHPADAAEPGLLYPGVSEVAVRRGSALIYNLVASSAADPAAEDTRLTFTNGSTTSAAFLRLFFVDGDSGNATSSFVCLTAGQTSSVPASVLRPGVTGFAVAIAVNGVNGCPAVFNEVSGQAQVRLASGFQGTLPALGVAALGAAPCAANATVAFDGVVYNRLPRVLHLTSVASPAEERTLLVVNRIGGDLSASSLVVGGITGTLYDDAQNAAGYSADTGSSRQFRSELTDSFPATAPPFGSLVPVGRTGWMRIMGAADVGLTGAALVLRPDGQVAPLAARSAGSDKAPAAVGAFTGALNLRVSTLSGAAHSYTFAVAPPTC
jgi:hypothetical protein